MNFKISPLLTHFGLILGLIPVFQTVSAQDNSVLSGGKWVKVEIQNPGLYKITKTDLLNSGFTSSEIIPEKIEVFGNGGKMLPQKNSDPRAQDLLQNPILVMDGGDGVFDDNDFILFYADGPDLLEFNQNNQLVYTKNDYSDASYYFVTIGNDNGYRIAARANENSSYPSITTYEDLQSHEVDENNILQALITSYAGSGREWYGEKFKDNLTQTFEFDGTNILSSGNLKLVTSLLAASITTSAFNTKLNGISLGDQPIPPIPDSRYGVKGQARTDTFSINISTIPNPASLQVELTYVPDNSISDVGYLNYLLLVIDKNLVKTSGFLKFQSLESHNGTSHTYSIEGVSPSDLIWDITNPLHPVNQEFELNGSIASFSLTSDSLRRFVVFDPLTDELTPDSFTTIENQNLRALATPNLLILAPSQFMKDAERLADFRRENDGLTVEVVQTTQVFNEFGSGSSDPTSMRDFIRYLYTKSPGLRYVLMFGKTSYDPKDRIESNTNFVPTYISRNSLDPLRSYTSDDYFGFMEDNEGVWEENLSGDETVEIGIGRLPVKTASEAKAVVDKLIQYSTSENALGSYRNEVYFIGDFGDANYHVDQSNKLATLVDTAFINFESKRFFLDNYPLIEQPGKKYIPEAEEKLTDVVNDGALIINYTGHGGEEGLSNEYLLRIPDMNSWNNTDKFPLWVTATCEFGRHDDPYRVSAGELTILKPKGGSIGLVTTARPVYANTNFELNTAFYNTVFKKQNGEYPRLGDIFKETKNNSLSGPNNRNFTLLGDPSMRLAYPKYSLELQSVNGKPVDQGDTLKALSKIKLSGIVAGSQGNQITDFNGTLFATVLDRKVQLQTLGQDTQPFKYYDRQGIIFSGQASITMGAFDFEFIVPADLNTDIDNAKVILYGLPENSLDDANGASEKLVVGGTSTNTENDITPPQIELYMEDISFKDGGVTGSNTLLLAKLTDANGINLLREGHEIRVSIDNGAEIILNDYYQAAEDNYTEGWVSYPINNLEKGLHTLSLTAYDTYNNQGTASLNFKVENERRLVIENFINYPNPIFDHTTFSFEHNRSGDNLYIEAAIIKLSGQIVQKLEWQIDNSPTTIDGLVWDGGNLEGKNLPAGIYICRLIVRSRIDGANNQVFRKMLILK